MLIILFFYILAELQKQLKGGSYFPLTAVQRFDAAVSILTTFLSFRPIHCYNINLVKLVHEVFAELPPRKEFSFLE